MGKARPPRAVLSWTRCCRRGSLPTFPCPPPAPARGHTPPPHPSCPGQCPPCSLPGHLWPSSVVDEWAVPLLSPLLPHPTFTSQVQWQVTGCTGPTEPGVTMPSACGECNRRRHGVRPARSGGLVLVCSGPREAGPRSLQGRELSFREP